MNLFRAGEHARNWTGYAEEAAAGLLSLTDIMEIFSADLFRRRADGDYVSNIKAHFMTVLETAQRVTNNDPFWQRQM